MERIKYRWCAVPQCKNTSISTPKKIFIDVPRKADIRRKWFDLARRNSKGMSINSPIYFCEDHFDLPNDMENYMRYHVMGFVNKVMLKPGCLPSKFQCQTNRKRSLLSVSCPTAIKSERLDVQEDHQESKLRNTEETSILISPDIQVKVERIECQPLIQDRSVQVFDISKYYQSKFTQTYYKSQTIATSPIKTWTKTVSTSPFKVEEPVNIQRSAPNLKRKIDEEKTNSEISQISLFSSVQPSSPSMKPLQEKLPSESSSLNEEDAKIEVEEEAMQAIDNMCKNIMSKPRLYIGLTKNCYYLIDLIQKNTDIPTKHILLCLKKLRLNPTFLELADQFGVSTPHARKIFKNNIPIIANFLKPFIVKLDKRKIKRHLPITFRHHFNKVSCVMNCFEIEIEKPTKPLHQALSWSEYKKEFTVKYLVSSTPNGLINYVSSGYGGQISDILLVENCELLDHLEPGSCVLADRGFKHMEQLLLQRNCQLLRPPSVVEDVNLSNHEALIRINMERIIKRIQEFSLLKPQSVVKSNLITVLDDCVIIACALINLRDEIYY